MFAAGVMIYKLVTGQFPFSDKIFDDEPGQNFVDHPKMAAIQRRLRSQTVKYQNVENVSRCKLR